MRSGFWHSELLSRVVAKLTWLVAIGMGLSGPSLVAAAEYEGDDVGATQAADAEQIVREGLRLGIAGDREARSQAMRRAIDMDAECELARWHRGELHVDGRWLSVVDSARKISRNVHFTEYQQRRDEALHDPQRELALADWCAKHQLPDVERMHLHRTLQGTTDVAIRHKVIERLGLRLYQGILLPAEDIKALEQQMAMYQQRLEKWTGVVETWAKGLSNRRVRQHAYIRRQIDEKLDVTAIPALEQIFSVHSEPLALELIALLGRLSDHDATDSLVRHSIDSDWASVRDAAAKQLKTRPLHDYVPLLLQELESPIQTRFVVNVGQDGLVRRKHYFYREGAQENHLLEASYVGGPVLIPTFPPRNNTAAAGLSDEMATPAAVRKHWAQRIRQAEIVRDLVAVRETVKSARMEREVAMANHRAAAANQVIFDALVATTGEVGLDQSASTWWGWWQDYTETYQGEKPTYQHQFRHINPSYIPVMYISLHSCFAAGTQVRTLSGMMNIEDIRVGDRVLSQDIETGELAYKLVLQTTERTPRDLLEIGLGETTITTTQGHPFWVNGVGWRMAKQLENGDQVHSIAGGDTIDRIEPAAPTVVYNLIVADFNNYFVGSAEVLVHDNTYRKPTRAVTPGLRPHEQTPWR
jgi:hypothetical protein